MQRKIATMKEWSLHPIIERFRTIVRRIRDVKEFGMLDYSMYQFL